MRRDSSMATAAGWLVAARLLVALLGWAGTVVIVRELTAADWGEFSLIFALLALIGLVSDLQMSRVVLSALDEGGDPGRIAGSYLVFRSAVGLVAYGAAVGYLALAGYSSDVVSAGAMAGLILILGAPVSALHVLYQAHFWFLAAAIGVFLGHLLQFGLIVAIALTGKASVAAFIAAALVGYALNLAWLLWLLRPHVRLRLEVRPDLWRRWLIEVAPLAAGWALASVYFRIDMVLLSKLDSVEAVGFFAVAYKFGDLIGYVPYAVMAPVLTVMVATWGRDRLAFGRAFRHAILTLGVAAVAVAVGFTIFAEDLLRFVYGARFGVAADAARMLLAGVALNFFTVFCFMTLHAVGRNRAYPIAALVGVVINVALNVLLIPRYSYDGSALATIVTEVAVLVILVYALVRVPGVRPLPIAALARIAVAGAVMAATGLGLATVTPTPAAGMIAIAAYLGAVHVLDVAGPGGLRALVRGARIAERESTQT